MNKYVFLYPVSLAVFFICITIYSIMEMLKIEFNIGSLIVIFIGIIYLSFGIYGYKQQPHTKVMKYYLLLMFVAALAISLSVPSSLHVPLAKKIEVLTGSFAPFVLLQFFQYFPYTKRPKIYLFMRYITFFLGIISSGSYIIHYLNNVTFFILITRFSIIINIAIGIITCCVLLFQHLKFNSDKIKNQITILIYGLLFSFIPVLLFSLIPEYILYLPAVPFYYSLISIIIFPFTLSYLLNKQNIIDFHINIKRVIYYILLIAICSVLFYLASDLILHITLNKTIYINLLFLFGIIMFFIGQQFIETLYSQSAQHKIRNSNNEKQLIHYQILRNNHLKNCAKFISYFIENTLNVNGVWVIWKQNNIPVSLHRTGVFKSTPLSAFMNKFIKSNAEETITINNQILLINPLIIHDEILGWIILGKQNAFIDNDRRLLKSIIQESTQLIDSAQTIAYLEKKLQKNQELFQQTDKFSSALLNEIEQKDKKISQFLHDEVLQSLILLSNKIDMLYKNNQITNETTKELKSYLKNIIHEIREMSHHLHPAIVEDIGLFLALKTLQRKVQENHNVTVDIEYNLPDYRVLNQELSIQVYSIIKELVNNGIKHSKCKIISVRLEEFNQFLKITVEDNGVGFDVEQYFSSLADRNNLGLITVQQRVNQLQGVLEIKSKPNFGTSINATVPIEWGVEDENQSIIS